MTEKEWFQAKDWNNDGNGYATVWMGFIHSKSPDVTAHYLKDFLIDIKRCFTFYTKMAPKIHIYRNDDHL